MLELSQLSKHFGGLKVLHHLDLTIPKGSIYGLIGPNGAGKTTVFNLITGLLTPDEGMISFNGANLAGRAPCRIAALGVARTFQNIRVFKEMTLIENVLIGSHRHLHYNSFSLLLNLPSFRRAEHEGRDRARELLSWVKLEHKANHPASTLSYGEQRRLELARALASDPQLLLLDEPVAGMNPAEKEVLMSEIARIRQRGYSIFIIEHDMRFVMGLCDRIAVLNFGRLLAEGTPGEIRNNRDVIEAYLGRDEA